GCSVLVIAWLGTQQAQQLLIGLSAIGALLMLAPLCIRQSFSASTNAEPQPLNSEAQPALELSFAGAIALVLLILFAALLPWSVPKVPGVLIAHGRYVPSKEAEARILYVGEGMNASVAVTRLNNGVQNFHVSGKVEASTEPQDMRLQRMLGHIPAL